MNVEAIAVRPENGRLIMAIITKPKSSGKIQPQTPTF